MPRTPGYILIYEPPNHRCRSWINKTCFQCNWFIFRPYWINFGTFVTSVFVRYNFENIKHNMKSQLDEWWPCGLQEPLFGEKQLLALWYQAAAMAPGFSSWWWKPWFVWPPPPSPPTPPPPLPSPPPWLTPSSTDTSETPEDSDSDLDSPPSSVASSISGPTRERSTGSKTSPWKSPKTTVRTKTLKKVRKVWEVEPARRTRARKVVTPPFKTAGPIASTALTARSLFDPCRKDLLELWNIIIC